MRGAHSAVLGRADGVKGYHDITRYPDARLIPGLVLFRWDAPLFFANAELFQERVIEAAEKSPTPVRWLVVSAEPVTSVDITAADILAELDHTLREMGIELCFAELKDPVKDKLKRFGLFKQLGQKSFFFDDWRGRQRVSKVTSGGLGRLGRKTLVTKTARYALSLGRHNECRPRNTDEPLFQSGRRGPADHRWSAVSPALLAKLTARTRACPFVRTHNGYCSAWLSLHCGSTGTRANSKPPCATLTR